MKQHGNTHYDEVVTQLEHALQSAHLARERGLPNEAVTAALLHDLGHILVDEHQLQSEFLELDMLHEVEGAKLLEAFFPKSVTEPIRLHVVAKRYLCSTEPGYFADLSAASQRSFELQGGRLSPDEQAKLERNDHLELALELRRIEPSIRGEIVPSCLSTVSV